MNILIISPKADNNPKGFSSIFQRFFQYPKEEPRELIEIAVQLPLTWERKLIDLNREKLVRKTIEWADFVIIRAGLKQYKSAKKLIEKCELAEKKIIATGELFDSRPYDFEHVDHLILNRTTFDPLVRDIECNTTKRIYNAAVRKEQLRKTAYSLLGFTGYFSRNIHLFSA